MISLVNSTKNKENYNLTIQASNHNPKYFLSNILKLCFQTRHRKVSNSCIHN